MYYYRKTLLHIKLLLDKARMQTEGRLKHQDFRRCLWSSIGATRNLSYIITTFFRFSFAFHITHQNFEDGEVIFNYFFLYPFLKAVAVAMDRGVSEYKVEFRPGEAHMKSITK